MVLSRLSLYNRRYSVFNLIQVVFKQSRYSYDDNRLRTVMKTPFVGLAPWRSGIAAESIGGVYGHNAMGSNPSPRCEGDKG